MRDNAAASSQTYAKEEHSGQRPGFSFFLVSTVMGAQLLAQQNTC